MVDRIRISEHGYALVVAPDGHLVAHGDPDKKALVAKTSNLTGNPLLAELRAKPGGVASSEYDDGDGRRVLGVAATIPTLGWAVIVEQPTREAYATTMELQRQLIFTIGAALLLMIIAGYVLGRAFIDPVFALKRATRDVAAGQLETRVRITTDDELGELGESFNTMADRLVALQEDVKRKERQAMFGRVAAGLVHDLSHPIQNIGNSTRLLLRDDVDAESRDMFRRTIERELATLKRFMEDLRHVVKPKPVERFAMDINGSVGEVVDAMRGEAERNGIAMEATFADGPLLINGDRFALGRVYRNLITNAIQATQPGGRVSVSTARAGNEVQVIVADTGSGIPAERLGAIFEDFVTTKRRGLGLGLAISKRIVEQLGGTIVVESEVGRGTSFTLRFPAHDAQPAQAAS
jgi:signal transduction histidine kinase